MNKFIALIEETGREYGLKPNKKRCETMYTMSRASTHTKIKKLQRKDEVKNLDCTINEKCANKQEILTKKTTEIMEVFKRLDILWFHSDCPIKFNLIAVSAVTRARL
jgi:hypothetical protein